VCDDDFFQVPAQLNGPRKVAPPQYGQSHRLPLELENPFCKGAAMIAVRPCAVTDLDAVGAIYAHHVGTGFGTFEELPPSIAELHQRFDALVQANFPFLVAAIDQRVAGYAYAAPFRPRAAYRYTSESSVYVAQHMQRRGVGQALMLRLIVECQKLGHRQLLAVIGDSNNHASIGLHTALGFARVGVFKEVGFKFERWVDVVLMQRPL
jgi:L-amino acid N-acyltransferase YncA